MGIVLKSTSEQTKPESAEIKDGEEAEEWPSSPFIYTYDDEGYLTSDGQPMAENNKHRREMNNTIEELEAYFLSRFDAYVAGNDYIHYKLGDFTKHISPDCYVVFGVGKQERDNFKTWQENGNTPAIVFEFTSEETRKKDVGDKYKLYQSVLRVPEYILFDPKGEYLSPRLQGYRLDISGLYTPIALDENDRIYSEQLDLFLEVRGDNLRLFDAKTGEYLRTPAEAEQERLLEKARADREATKARREAQARREEAKRANTAEAEIARLRAELEALRQNSGQ